MDFALSEDQVMFQKMVRDFATRELEPVAARIDETEEFPAQSIQKMAGLGLFGITIDEKYGGCGGDSVQLAIATEEIARPCAATSAIYLASLSLATFPIARFGTEERRQHFLPRLAQGKTLACFALTESGAGSNPAAMETTDKKQGGGYVLNGNKVFITNGAEAGVTVAFATLDKSQGHRAVTGFIVEKGTPGYSVGKKEKKLGIRASSTAQLVFEDCWVPASQVLGGEGKGFRVALEAIDSSRISVAGQAVGIARGRLLG